MEFQRSIYSDNTVDCESIERFCADLRLLEQSHFKVVYPHYFMKKVTNFANLIYLIQAYILTRARKIIL